MTQTTRAAITVRPALAADAAAVRDVGLSAWRATYTALVGPDTVERFIGVSYTLERVASRIERDVMFVAACAGGDESGVDAFIEVIEEVDRPHIVAFYTRPGTRGRGLGTALLTEVVAAFPGRDISADVLEGNDLGEPFYVARGFELGEVIIEDLAGEPIRERRWWLRAGREER
ncbi:MAG TPA: GNAT family N-acetyltransferase [Candidatus Limnocylindrales bacterium]|nr:GNAT family N-acetyltransferase [Candidatus Limnocylindrales bacterium]